MSLQVRHYCLRRTRSQLLNLVWAALLLLVGAVLAAVFWSGLGVTRTGRDLGDYFMLAFSGFGGAAALAGGSYEAFASIRNALFPEKSRLAASIRSQLPCPEEAPGVAELFDMVDRDIEQNGRWFDRVAVGREWVLGDEATLLSRVRAVFGRNEVQTFRHGGRTQTRRVVQLVLLDDRRQAHITGLRDPRKMEPLLDCLRGAIPDALFCPYGQFLDYCEKTEEEWEELLRGYNARKARREAAAI